MNRPDPRLPSRTAVLARWLTRISLFVGGWLLLNHFAPTRTQTPATITTNPTGRGQPTIPPSPAARLAGHETSDMDALTMAKLAAGLLVTAAIVMGGVVLLNRLLSRMTVANQPNLTTQQQTPIQPPAPNLQADAPADIASLHLREDTLLNTYAWANPNHTRARIPIARAMTLMAGHPLDTAP